ncbi:MAG: LCP family protein [Anaerolineae bacterium]|jgi:LCP family protein required for cell wall assembly
MSRNSGQAQTRSGRRSPGRLTWAIILAAVLAAIILAIALLSGGDGEEADTPVAAQLTSDPASTPTPLATAVTPPPCTAPDDWTTHTVAEGDTLFSLAQKYDTDVETLKLVNCLSTDVIRLEEVLYVPPPLAISIAAATPLPGTQPTPADPVEVAFATRYVNIILLGSDKREDDSTWRTDTMIVVSVDTERKVVRLLSIPRDLWVNIPGHGYERINSADMWGELAQEGSGPALVKQTVYENLGIPIQYYVRADFDGFIEIIDAVGGVDIDVECPLPDIEMEAGIQHMDGEDALLYARSRITTNDFDRSRRQRKLLMALWGKAKSSDIITKIPALWMAMAGTFETDLPLDKVLSLGYLAVQLKPNYIFSQSIGPWQTENWITSEGYEVLLPLNDEIEELLNGFYGPIDFDFLERVSETQIQVLNGTWKDEAARLAATSLSWMGFQISGTGMADRQDYAQSRVIVLNADEDVAELAAQSLDLLPSSLEYQSDPASTVGIRIILGEDWDPCADR